MRKLFLHIGTHKTGSTSIQKFCEAHREQIESRGLFYPDYQPLLSNAPYAHHQFAKAVADQGRDLSFVDTQKLASRWADYCEANSLNMLISAEPMYRLEVQGSHEDRVDRRMRYFERIRDVFSRFEIVPIVVFRRPDSLIESLYRENVMTNHKSARVGFSAFVEENHNRFFSYGTTAEILEACFSRKPQVYFFEKLVKGSLPIEHQFLKDLGCDVADLPAIGQVRKSLNNAQLSVKRILNEHILDEKQSNKVTAWLKLPETESMLNECLPNTKLLSLWGGRSERVNCLVLAQPELLKLSEIVGVNPNDMFPQVQEEGGRGKIGDPTISEISKMMLAALEYGDFRKLPSSSKAYRS